MAIGKYANVTTTTTKAPVKQNKEKSGPKYAGDGSSSWRVDEEEFAKEWNEACELYRKGIVIWSKKWCKEWDEVCRKLNPRH